MNRVYGLAALLLIAVAGTSAHAEDAQVAQAVVAGETKPEAADAFPFTLHGELVGMTRYVYRGYATSGDKPAWQVGLDLRHASGLGITTYVSRAHYPGTRGPEVSVSATYRGEMGAL